MSVVTGLAEILADESREVLDHSLLAAGDAVAVVKEQHHCPPAA